VLPDDDPSDRIMHRKDVAVLALCYVDDGLVATRTTRGVDALVELVESIFELRKLGEPSGQRSPQWTSWEPRYSANGELTPSPSCRRQRRALLGRH
jgi:hypothetical protein